VLSPAAVLPPPVRPRFPWLTALRGFFAVWIVLNHLGNPSFGPAPWIDDVLHIVDLRTFDLPTTGFFVLSGIIFGSGRQPAPGLVGARGFWRARLARIYPIYLLALLACAPRGWVKSGGDLPTFLLSGLCEALFLQGWVEGMPGYVLWNPVGWFMSCIALCYLAFPLVSRWILRPSGTTRLLVAGLLAALATDALGVLTSSGTLPGTLREIRYFPPYSLPAFVLGCVLGALLGRGAKVAALGLTVAASFLAATTIALLFESQRFFFMVLAGPLSLGVVALSLVPRRPPAPFIGLGEVAFTVYMMHWTLHLWFDSATRWIGIQSAYRSPLGLVVYLVALVTLSRILYSRFERPLQRILDPRRATSPA